MAERREEIRRADPTDREDLAALATLRRAWSAEDEPAGAPPLGSDGGFGVAFTAWARSEPRTFHLALREGRAIGMVNVLTYFRMPSPGCAPSTWGYLANAFVRPEHRGVGAGTRLLEHALADCRRRGHVRVVLSPSPRSVHLYRRVGFAPADGLLVWTPEVAGPPPG